MKNLKVAMKLIVAFALVLAVFGVSIMVTLYELDRLSEEMDFYDNGPFDVNNAVNGMKSSLEGGFKFSLYAITATDPQTVSSASASALGKMQAFSKELTNLKNANAYVQQIRADAELQTLVNKIIASHNVLLPYYEELLNLANNNDQERAIAYFENTAMPYMSALNDALDDLTALADSASTGTIENYDRLQKEARTLLYILLGLSYAVVIVLCYLISRSLNRPIKEIEAAAKEMAKGNLKTTIKYKSKDELGSLAESMRFVMTTLSGYVENISATLGEVANGNLTVSADMEYLGDFAQIRASLSRILDSLNDTLGSINQASDQVATGSEQVSGGAQTLASGSSQQAASIEEFSSAISQVQAQAEQNNRIANNAYRETQTAGELMGTSMDYMNQMSEAMHEINDSSQNIAKVIKVIEDIAFQTNILALNAAVEAARAGSAGKGFAVVADEVRNLASKSAEAAKETAALIESSVQSVSVGNQIATKTGESLVEVAKIAESNAKGMQQLSEASHQQMLAIAEITNGMDQISAVIQANSATAEESAAASEELSGQANMLKNLVARFRVKGHTTGYSIAPMIPSFSGEMTLPEEFALSSGSGGDKYEF